MEYDFYPSLTQYCSNFTTRHAASKKGVWIYLETRFNVKSQGHRKLLCKILVGLFSSYLGPIWQPHITPKSALFIA